MGHAGATKRATAPAARAEKGDSGVRKAAATAKSGGKPAGKPPVTKAPDSKTLPAFVRQVRGLLGTEDIPGYQSEAWELIAEYVKESSKKLKAIPPKPGKKKGSLLKVAAPP